MRRASCIFHPALLANPPRNLLSVIPWMEERVGGRRAVSPLAARPPPNETRRINALPVLPPKSSGRQHTLTSMLRRRRISFTTVIAIAYEAEKDPPSGGDPFCGRFSTRFAVPLSLYAGSPSSLCYQLSLANTLRAGSSRGVGLDSQTRALRQRFFPTAKDQRRTTRRARRSRKGQVVMTGMQWWYKSRTDGTS